MAPAKSKVSRCVRKVMKKGKSKVSAIKICQKKTKMSYKTGRKSKKKNSNIQRQEELFRASLEWDLFDS